MRETRDRILREHTPETFDRWLMEKKMKRLIERFGPVETQTLSEVTPTVFFDTQELKEEFLLKMDPVLSDVYEVVPNEYVFAA